MVMIHVAPIVRTIRITGLIESRVSAKLVCNYMEDLTPDEEYAKRIAAKENKFVYRQRGLGRPTKRERREIDNLKKYLGV
jgi:ribosome-associated heat shock protein Hsp15